LTAALVTPTVIPPRSIVRSLVPPCSVVLPSAVLAILVPVAISSVSSVPPVTPVPPVPAVPSVTVSIPVSVAVVAAPLASTATTALHRVHLALEPGIRIVPRLARLRLRRPRLARLFGLATLLAVAVAVHPDRLWVE
jgi:hypothetical protein